MNYSSILLSAIYILCASCSSEEILTFSNPVNGEAVTIIDSRNRRYIFSNKFTSIKDGIDRSKGFIELETSKTTTSSNGVYICWGTALAPIQVFCPKTSVVKVSIDTEVIQYIPTEPSEAGFKFQRSGCFVYDYETKSVYPKHYAIVK